MANRDDAAFVRREKREDDDMTRRLVQVYGSAKTALDDGYRRSKKGWRCAECRCVNYEARLACGECLAVHPDVAATRGQATQRKQLRIGGNNKDGSTTATANTAKGSNQKDATGEGEGSGRAAAALAEVLRHTNTVRRPGESCDASIHVLHVGGRSYRTFAGGPPTAAVSRRKQQKAQQRSKSAQDRDDDGGEPDDDDEAECQPDGADNGDDDEPSCGAGDANFTASAAAAAKSCGDLLAADDDLTTPGSGGAVSAPASSMDAKIAYDQRQRVFKAKVLVPSTLHGLLIGKGGAGLAELRRSTNAMIAVPNAEAEDEHVVVTAASKEAVAAALQRLEAFVVENRGKVGYTHFLCIPLGKDPAVEAAATVLLDGMKAAIAAPPATITAAPAPSPSAALGPITTDHFHTPSWLHFTLLPLTLLSDEQVDTARKLLARDVAQVARELFPSKEQHRQIRLNGAGVMGDNPGETHVVYLKPEEGDEGVVRLRRLVAETVRIFCRHGLCGADAGNDLILHATILNSKFAATKAAAAAADKNANQNHKGRGGRGDQAARRVPFNAAPALAYVAASRPDVRYLLHTMELSQMNTQQSGGRRRDFYKCDGEVSF